MLAILQIVFRGIVIIFFLVLAGFGMYNVLPESIRIEVPFTSQAPGGVWTEPWQNACEEASIIMIDNFYKGDMLTKEEARDEILSVFELKESVIGTTKDESMETVAQIINSSNLVWAAVVVNNPKIQHLKDELAKGRPIIAPVYARVLDNPYYSGEGPDYHVVVMTGYDDVTGEFITHDPGTERGENFRYSYQKFYDAISDYLSSEEYGEGPKRVLFTRLKEN